MISATVIDGSTFRVSSKIDAAAAASISSASEMLNASLIVAAAVIVGTLKRNKDGASSTNPFSTVSTEAFSV